MAEVSKRISLFATPENRDTTTSRDSKLVNGYVEKLPNGNYAVYKRPGIVNVPAYAVSAGAGQGIFFYESLFFVINAGTVYVNGSSVGSVSATGGPYFFITILGAVRKVVFSNTTHMYSYDLLNGLVAAGTVSLPPYPIGYGLAYLDGTVYTITLGGNVNASEINDISTWDPISYLIAQMEPDLGVAIAKQLTYVVVFKQWSTEFFYDAGNPVGSPLSPYESLKVNWGCRSGTSVLDIDGDLFWMGSTKSGAPQILMLHAATASVISSPEIERLLFPSNCSTVYAWSFKGHGHNFYVITCVDINLTLAYDIGEKTWSQWSDTNGNYLPFTYSTFANQTCYLQHATNGKIYSMDASLHTDDGNSITVDIYTPNFDGGVNRRKTISMMRFVGDQTPGSVLQVRCNDSDYDPTKWTNFRRVDMNKQRPFLMNCGTFYRRAYHIQHRGNTGLRLMDLDIDVDLGTL